MTLGFMLLFSKERNLNILQRCDPYAVVLLESYEKQYIQNDYSGKRPKDTALDLVLPNGNPSLGVMVI